MREGSRDLRLGRALKGLETDAQNVPKVRFQKVVWRASGQTKKLE